jgi:trimethylamine-N-oxide reductase (cytochrome c)
MMKNLTWYADIVLPICTVYERNDVTGLGDRSHTGIIWKSKAIENMWESKSDMNVFYGLSDKLGFYDEYTEGNSEEEWMKKSYIKAGGEKFMSWEDFKKKGYLYIPFPEKGGYPRIAFRSYYEKPEGEGLETPSGKIEFFAQSIYKQYGNDPEIPTVPHHIPDWEGRNTHPLVEKYPLQLQQHHPKLRYHTQLSNITILKEISTVKIKKNGYYYEPCWIHPKDAAKRGIKNGDLVRVFNDRAQILTAAFITERIIPGVVNVCYGSGYDPMEPGNPESLDKGGESNLLSGGSVDNHYRWISKHAHGLAPNSCLVEVEKWRG